MKGIQIRWSRRPWNRASPSNPGIRKYSIEMGVDMHISLAVRERMRIQHDGAPRHFSVDVRNHLNAVFPDRWIWRGGPIPWRARWSDLNPLHYFLWGYLKSLVFEIPVETDIELVVRIVAAYDIIHNTSEIFVRVWQNLVCRCHFCIEFGGRQFEQLLQDAKWYVNCVNVLYLQVTVTNVNKK